MKTYVVIDTNVLVSAMITPNHDAATARVVRAIAEKRLIPVYNDEIMSEYHKVLRRKKFNLLESDIEANLNTIRRFGIKAERVASGETFPDASDAVFYEVALSKDDAYLVTGNLKHFPVSPIVVTPPRWWKYLRIR